MFCNRASLLKTYNKTLDEGFFPMIVVDAPNIKVHFNSVLSKLPYFNPVYTESVCKF